MKVRERNTWTRASLNPEGLQDVMWCSPCLKVGRLLNESGQMFESPQLPTMLPGTLSPMPCPESPHFVPSLCSHLSHSPEAASVEMSPAPESSWLRPHGSSPISGCPAAHASTPRACCSWSWSSPSCLIDPGLFIGFLCLSFNGGLFFRQIRLSLTSLHYVSCGFCIYVDHSLLVEDCLSIYCISSENMGLRLAEAPVRADRRNHLALFCCLNSNKDKKGSCFKIRKGL